MSISSFLVQFLTAGHGRGERLGYSWRFECLPLPNMLTHSDSGRNEGGSTLQSGEPLSPQASMSAKSVFCSSEEWVRAQSSPLCLFFFCGNYTQFSKPTSSCPWASIVTPGNTRYFVTFLCPSRHPPQCQTCTSCISLRKPVLYREVN